MEKTEKVNCVDRWTENWLLFRLWGNGHLIISLKLSVANDTVRQGREAGRESERTLPDLLIAEIAAEQAWHGLPGKSRIRKTECYMYGQKHGQDSWIWKGGDIGRGNVHSHYWYWNAPDGRTRLTKDKSDDKLKYSSLLVIFLCKMRKQKKRGAAWVDAQLTKPEMEVL